MSAILKDKSEDKEQENQLAVITDKFSSVDFYTKTNDVVKKLKKHIELVNSINFEVTENGKKKLKEYQSDERKLIKAIDVFRKEGYANLTAEAKIKHDAIFTQIKMWTDAIASKSTQFEEFEANQLLEINKMLISHLNALRKDSTLLRDEFITDSVSEREKLCKLSALTPNGSLTSATKNNLKGILDAELAKQSMHDNRILTIENRCLRADINPPLGKVHFGDVFWADEKIFEFKLEELVTAEIARRVEMALRIEAELKKKEQAKIDAALAQERERIRQEEQAKIAQEVPVIKETVPIPPISSELLRKRARDLNETALHTDNYTESNKLSAEVNKLKAQAKELEEKENAIKALAVNKKKLVTIHATFQVSVRDTISIEAVVNHFKTKLPDDLKNALIVCIGE